jgi:competence/damage-inducible protein CinA-like protein
MIKAELLSIGDELLIGQVINTNVSKISKLLGAIGIDTHRITTIGDDEKAIVRAIHRAWNESDIVIATGGLGPTHDDISKNVVARFFHKKINLDATTLKHVQNRFKRLGYNNMPESNISQALVPDDFIALRNDEGTAPGLWYEEKKKVFVILPGVPHEMEWLMTKWVVPKLRKRYKGQTSAVIIHKVLLTAGLGESVLAEKIGNPKNFLAKGTTLAFLPRIGGVRLRITAKSDTAAAAKRAIGVAEHYIRSKVENYIYGEGDTLLEDAVVSLLQNKRSSVSTAESCTAGMLAMRITNVAGASDVFPGGVVAYANEIKTLELSIPGSTIKKYGAVSEQTAKAMAEHVRQKFDTTFGIAITGIAGPSGGSKEKPVGTVWLAIAEKGKPTHTKLLHNTGNRAMIRERATEIALEFLRQTLIRT